jgi:hypothetical protein
MVSKVPLNRNLNQGFPLVSSLVTACRCAVDTASSIAKVGRADADRMTTQLGTPRGRYDKHSSKFSLSKKPRFNDPVGKSQTPEGDAC